MEYCPERRVFEILVSSEGGVVNDKKLYLCYQSVCLSHYSKL